MADYHVSLDGTVTKNRKKKKESHAYPVNSSGKVTENVTETKQKKQSQKNTTDIAPVKTTISTNAPSSAAVSGVVAPTVTSKKKEEKDKKTWFQKSQGTTKQTIGASSLDLGGNVSKGLLGVGEKIVDAFATLAPYALYGSGTSFVSQKQRERTEELVAEAKADTSEFVKKDLYNEEELVAKHIVNPIEKKYGIDTETMSVFGEKSDELAQSAGQMGANVAASLINPMLGTVMLGATSFGAEAENAFLQGATYDEAVVSASISAGAEILTEKISGGISLGGNTLDDLIPIDSLTQGISSKLVRNLINVGVDATGEGFEEIVAGYASAVGQKLTYMEEKELKEIFSSEEALDSFLGGAILGGISSTGKSTVDTVKGKDSLSGLTNAEKAVFDKVYNDTISEAEKDGKKLTQSEKNEIYDDVMSKLEKGAIDTDTIGSVLGGETYNKLKSIKDNETKLQEEYDSMKKEYDTLNKMKIGEMTGEQTDRKAELKKLLEEYKIKIEELKTTSNESEIRSQLDVEMLKLTQGTKLFESYKEKARRGQELEIDIESYKSDSAKQTAQNLKDFRDSNGYGVNNTNATHDYLDFVTKVSEAKDHTFKFMTTTQLEEAVKNGEYNIEGNASDVEAFIDKEKKEIIINMDANKSLSSLVGHEITHTLEADKASYKPFQDALIELSKTRGEYDARWESIQRRYSKLTEEQQLQELTSDLVGDYIFGDSDFVQNLSTENPNIFKKIYNEIKYLWKMATAGSKEKRQLETAKKKFEDAWRNANNTSIESDVKLSVADDGTEIKTDRVSEVQFSIANNSLYMDNAIAKNNASLLVDKKLMDDAKNIREKIAARMNEIKDRGLVGLPEDIEGNTFISNSSYGGTEENTTICPRSLSAEAFVDAVSEMVGRPLTVEEQIYLSQDLQGRSLTPECTYCYVATDRKAYRAFLGQYVAQRDAVLAKLKENPNADVSRNGELYQEFLKGRKDTNPMYKRFKMWTDAYQNGKPLIDANHLANMSKLMGDINSEFGAELKPQIADAMKYAQSASWAKKRVNYLAYNGHILKWKQDRINKLNSHYGLRMYSFSYFHPAFTLENMQMITDASVRGLKMLGYTKDTDFVEIFAPSGMNINISTFGFVKDGVIAENNLIGAEWQRAKELREQYPNVGITFVATDDTLVDWALNQDWIDVVIPFHLVRTGKEVAEAFKYHDYTSESSDTKTSEWKKGDSKYIAPTEHNNDKATYLKALEKNHLKPRFERFVNHPNYMKLVNECRLPASESKPVQPIFNEDASMKALAKLEANGYYQPVGGSVDRMYEIAAEVADKMQSDIAPTQYRIADDIPTKSYGHQYYAKDLMLAPTTEYYSAESDDIPVDTVSFEDEIPMQNDAESNHIPGEDLTRKNAEKIRTIKAEIKGHQLTKDVTRKEFDDKIAQKKSEYESLKRKDTKKAVDLRNQITRLETKRDSLLRGLDNKIERANKRIEGIEQESRYEKRKTKQNEYRELFGRLMGDTSTWIDKKMGISYQTNTLRRNLRDIVRDASGEKDIARADAIYDELQGSVNRNEASKNREANALKKQFKDMKINNVESTYIQMLGELRHNPDSKLKNEVVEKYYKKHESKIDTQKVDRAIEEARKLYDSLYDRVNAALSEHGFKEIGYRKGYFPHFNDPKRNWLAKLLNWKVNNDEIPTDIAGLTEMFEPQRTWQSFDKHRTGDATDYNFLKGLDNYVNGSLDWIYHIEDIQKHRAFETEIRYRHSSEAVQKKIDEYRNNQMLSNEEVETLIQSALKEAKNPLGNFVTDLHTRTNILAGKKSSKDRNMESDFNRHAYSVMTNITNRVTANQVVGSISSALTNFIPITQSWGQVNPTSSLVGMKKTIQSYMNDDGVVAKSDFLTNRLAQNEALYKDAWDKIGDKVGGLMEIVDNFTSQTVWRSKYHENINNGMSEAQAIKDADQFAENVIGGRSKGNMPTIFHAKNPVTKMLTSFQLEVANQYGYMFKDMPQDIGKNAIGKLTKGYATMFIGAYAYNALYSTLTGRNAAFDPIRILQEFLGDLGGDDEEEKDVAGAISGLASNIADEIPFVGGLLGGGRIPISSALPYNASISDAYADVVDGDWKSVLDELSKPLYYGVLPMGGGQIRKTVQGLSMFDDDLPVSGSYTKSGNLRFPVEDTFLNKLQAGVFGQYSSANAREYFDKGQAPLKEKQIQEYIDVDIPISEYWDYRDGLKGLSKLSDKADYINSLDLPIDKKNILVNNQSDRKEPIDLTGFDDDYENFEEFDFAMQNPEKYEIALQVGGFKAYQKYQEGMSGMKLAEKVDYVSKLDLTTEQKNALINGETDRKEPIDLTGYENYSSFEEFEMSKESPKKYSAAKVIGHDEYQNHMDAIGDIRADKDSNGKTINGSAKEKKTEYINSLNLDYGQKIILYRSLFDSKEDKNTYNRDIIDYLNSRNDVSYEEMVEILESLDMKVHSDGTVTW